MVMVKVCELVVMQRGVSIGSPSGEGRQMRGLCAMTIPPGWFQALVLVTRGL